MTHTRTLLPAIASFVALGAWTQAQTANGAPSVDPPIRVACVGDSITQGWSAADIESWPSVLGALLGPSYNIMNFGVGGTCMLKKGDLPYWNPDGYKKFGYTNGYDKALISQPDIVIITLGTNDTKPQNFPAHSAEFEPDAEAMIESFRNLPSHPRVILGIPTPVIDGGNYGITEDVLTKGVIPALKQAAAKENIETLDLFDYMQAHPDQFWDNVHPTPEGYTSIARCAYLYLTQAPLVDPDSPIFIKSDNVTITPNPAADATVYTTDGSAPTIDSPKYTAPFPVADTCVIKSGSILHGKLVPYIALASVNQIAPNPPAQVDSPQPGLSLATYAGYDANHPGENLDNLTNGSLSVQSQLTLPQAIQAGTALDFKGYINVPTTDLYAFTTTTLMGSQLYIDDKLVINTWQYRLHSTTKTGYAALQAGYHKIRLEYFCGGGVLTLKARWANSTIPIQDIPAPVLFHAISN